MPAPTPLYLGNDHAVSLATLTDEDGTAQTSATVTWELYEEATEGVMPDPDTDTPVASGSLAHSSDGTYTGAMESSDLTSITAGSVYWLRYVAAQSGKNGEWWERLRAAYRQPGS